MLGVGVLIAEIVAIILVIANVQTLKMAIQIIVSGIVACVSITVPKGIIIITFCRQDVVFSIAVAFSYGATGISSAAYAGVWGKPPEACLGGCDDGGLTATNALSTVRHINKPYRTAYLAHIGLFAAFTP